ncbi:MAG TPA: hypothetical protein VGV10_02075 [Thermoleophilaceae bacterium]|nr:hypothetical protein [Thermoleophilaceae bacterium]
MNEALHRARVLALATLAVMFALAPAEVSAQSGAVLVVGDSLEVGTGPHLRRELDSAALTIDARTGRGSSEGVRVLSERLRPAHRVVVFDLGVNDDPSRPRALARNLGEARSLVGDRCLIVATLTRPVLNGVSIEGMNRAVRKFVAETPTAHLFDWRAATQSDPGLLGPNELHPGPAGYVGRARLLARVIEDCLDPDAPEPDAPDPPSQQREEPAVPSPRRPRPEAEDPAWVDWLLARREEPLLDYVRNGIDRVEEAARDAISALSPQPPEPTLGGPARSSAGRGARLKGR